MTRAEAVEVLLRDSSLTQCRRCTVATDYRCPYCNGRGLTTNMRYVRACRVLGCPLPHRPVRRFSTPELKEEVARLVRCYEDRPYTLIVDDPFKEAGDDQS